MGKRKPIGLSKTSILKGMQCPKALYLSKNPPAFDIPPAPDRAAKFALGQGKGVARGSRKSAFDSSKSQQQTWPDFYKNIIFTLKMRLGAVPLIFFRSFYEPGLHRIQAGVVKSISVARPQRLQRLITASIASSSTSGRYTSRPSLSIRPMTQYSTRFPKPAE